MSNQLECMFCDTSLIRTMRLQKSFIQLFQLHNLTGNLIKKYFLIRKLVCFKVKKPILVGQRIEKNFPTIANKGNKVVIHPISIGHG